MKKNNVDGLTEEQIMEAVLGKRRGFVPGLGVGEVLRYSWYYEEGTSEMKSLVEDAENRSAEAIRMAEAAEKRAEAAEKRAKAAEKQADKLGKRVSNVETLLHRLYGPQEDAATDSAPDSEPDSDPDSEPDTVF